MTTTEPGRRYTVDFVPGHSDRAIMLGNPVLDRLVSTAMEIGAELWMQRRRMLALERALARHGIAAADAIEQAVPSETEVAEERALRDAMIDRIFGPLLAAIQEGTQPR